jgi:hypothetical protein
MIVQVKEICSGWLNETIKFIESTYVVLVLIDFISNLIYSYFFFMSTDAGLLKLIVNSRKLKS